MNLQDSTPQELTPIDLFRASLSIPLPLSFSLFPSPLFLSTTFSPSLPHPLLPLSPHIPDLSLPPLSLSRSLTFTPSPSISILSCVYFLVLYVYLSLPNYHIFCTFISLLCDLSFLLQGFVGPQCITSLSVLSHPLTVCCLPLVQLTHILVQLALADNLAIRE